MAYLSFLDNTCILLILLPSAMPSTRIRGSMPTIYEHKVETHYVTDQELLAQLDIMVVTIPSVATFQLKAPKHVQISQSFPGLAILLSLSERELQINNRVHELRGESESSL